MKQIQLKQISEQGEVVLDYKAALANILGNANVGDGYTIEQMRQHVRVLDRLEQAQAGGELLLEDAEHAAVVARLQRNKWPVASRHILRFIDDVLAAPEPAEKAHKQGRG
jgi:hypothetical protein